jgi:hypothetical protein
MKARPRRDAYSPTSAAWTLYNPRKFYEALLRLFRDHVGHLPREVGVDVVNFILEHVNEDAVRRLLEENGFSKAVRIREELIREKTRLLAERKAVEKRRIRLERRLRATRRTSADLGRRLVLIRNVLRIPREDDRKETR